MGLKNRLNKMKSFLFDEVEDKEEKKESKKERRKKIEVEEAFNSSPVIEKPVDEDTYSYDFDDYTSESVDTEMLDITKSRTEKKEFKIPDLTDNDFFLPEKEPVAEIQPVIEERPLLYQGSKRKEETRRFKPSPNISPVYGLLDEKGNTINDEDQITKTVSNKEEISFDAVRKKAYGNMDEELENTLKKLNGKTIEEAEKENEEELLRVKKNGKKDKRKQEEVKLESIEEDKKQDIPQEKSEEIGEDEMILPSVSFKEIDVNSSDEPVSGNDDDEDEETKEQDLFNLIDTMYSKDGEE